MSDYRGQKTVRLYIKKIKRIRY